MKIIFLSIAVLFTGFLTGMSQERKQIKERDPLKWPFSQTSIWNMPIGSNARYLHAHIERAMGQGMTIDEDYIVMAPDAPLMEIGQNFAGWDKNKSRCEVEGKVIFSAPIPASFIVSPDTWDGTTPNAGLAVLMPDGRTIKQTQPFAHCSSGKPATSQYMFGDVDIYGDGYYGAHGATGLSAIGGTLTLRELTPTPGPICHEMKVNIYAKKNVYYGQQTKGYRWPGKSADGYAEGNYYTERTLQTVKECRMGALLALPITMNLDSLGFETRPARILAEAFQHYGAYLVDDTAWDVYAIMTEWSPEGRFDDQFKNDWGFSMKENTKNTPWARDMDRIFMNLHVVDNNTATSIGGGGTPLAPLAPPFNTTK